MDPCGLFRGFSALSPDEREALLLSCKPESVADAVVASTVEFEHRLSDANLGADAAKLSLLLDGMDGCLDGTIVFEERCLNQSLLEAFLGKCLSDAFVGEVRQAFHHAVFRSCDDRVHSYSAQTKRWYENFKKDVVTVAVEARNPDILQTALILFGN